MDEIVDNDDRKIRFCHRQQRTMIFRQIYLRISMILDALEMSYEEVNYEACER